MPLPNSRTGRAGVRFVIEFRRPCADALRDQGYFSAAASPESMSALGVCSLHIKGKAADMTSTVDPVEIRGYEYHSGVTFTLFSR